MATLAASPPELHRLSIEEYHRLVKCGGLDEGARFELIDGLLLDMSPKSPERENAIQWLMEWIAVRLDQVRYQLRICGALTIGTSEPEPDLMIFERPAPRHEHPSRALLVIEVALSSKERGLELKPDLYAGAVEEYWVVDLQARHAVVHRDGANGVYLQVDVIAPPEELSSQALDIGQLPTGELFAAIFGEG
ncbi:MAG TPA: Uma2 family endonuclease [Solirubrobacteraceae bacterium]|nr:Uma2 family endonuclease [Solirubrobacteraceae bacterium]